MYTIEQFKQDVLSEAINIKQYATDDEVRRLNPETLQPTKHQGCIYGQMTGHCDNERALYLIEKCAKRFVADSRLTFISVDGFERIQKHINGEVVEGGLRGKRSSDFEEYTAHSSMIEAYIILPEANKNGLIAFIKDQAESVEL